MTVSIRWAEMYDGFVMQVPIMKVSLRFKHYIAFEAPSIKIKGPRRKTYVERDNEMMKHTHGKHIKSPY